MRALLLLATLLGACYSPSYEGFACGPGGECPAGLHCNAQGSCADDVGQTPGADASPGSDAGPDLAPPVTTIGKAPPEFTNVRSASIEFAAAEPADYFCRVNGAPFLPCTSPYQLDELTERVHTFDVYATDAAGNTESTPVRARWTVDVTRPTVAIASGPPAISGTTATFNLDADEPECSFECSVDSIDAGAWKPCSDPSVLIGLPEGDRSFRARARDRAGNTAAETAAFTWRVDADAFSTSIVDGPGSVSGKAVTFTFSSTRPGDSTYECDLDPAGPPSWAACANPLVLSDLPGGAHTLFVRAKDTAGNTAIAASQLWNVDATGPTTTIAYPAAGGLTVASVDFAFSANEGATFSCKLDALAPVACESPYARTLAHGSHTMKIVGTDLHGNIGAEATVTWNVDAVAPTLSVSSPASLAPTGKSVMIQFAAEAGATLACKRDQDPAYSACTSSTTWSLTNLSFGLHTVIVRATDVAGNVTTVSRSFTVGPSVSISAPSGTTGKGASVSFTTDEATATFQCKLDGGSFVSCTNPWSLTNLGHGAHTVYVKATASGQTGPEASRAWSVDATPPTATLGIDNAYCTDDRTFQFGYSTNEPSTTTATCYIRATSAQFGAPVTCNSLTSHLYEGLLASGSGITYEVKVRMTDPYGNFAEASHTFSSKVDCF